jgi:phosphomannomutase
MAQAWFADPSPAYEFAIGESPHYMSHPVIKFGTDGWRGVIADDFTFENVRTAAAAIATYIHRKEDPSKGICIGYDTRFGSRAFAQAVAEVISASGIPVRFANSGTVFRGEASRCGRRSDDYLQS